MLESDAVSEKAPTVIYPVVGVKQTEMFEAHCQYGFCLGVVSSSYTVVMDMEIRSMYRRRGYGTALLEGVKRLFRRPVVPLSVIEEATPFWDNWARIQNIVQPDMDALVRELAMRDSLQQ